MFGGAAVKKEEAKPEQKAPATSMFGAKPAATKQSEAPAPATTSMFGAPKKPPAEGAKEPEAKPAGANIFGKPAAAGQAAPG